MKAFSSPDQMVSHSNGAERERRKARENYFATICGIIKLDLGPFTRTQMLSHVTCHGFLNLCLPTLLKSSAIFPTV